MVSVSGVRGIVGRSMTPELVLRYAQAFGVLQGRGAVIVARDTRPSGVLYRDAAAAGLAAVGCRVVDIGITPTPTALGSVLTAGACGGIIITASHNPSPWNGLKFVGPEGSFLTGPQMTRLSARVAAAASLVPWNTIQLAVQEPHAIAQHIARILKAVDAAAIRRRRFTVALDSCNGAGAVAAPALLKTLGCRVIGIHVTPDGDFPRGPEPTPKNLAALSRAVRRSRAAIGFAQDPDADRLSLVDEQGRPLSEELTLALAIQHRLRQLEAAPRPSGQRLRQRRGPVVVNLSTSRMIDDVASAAGVRVARTPVGEVHVVQRMRAAGAVIGGEGNGGVIDPRITWGRDSLAGMALVLEALANTDRPLSVLATPLARWVMVKRSIAWSPARTAKALAGLKRRFPGGRMTGGDGVRVDVADGWVHVRPSNTEPVVRVFAEAATEPVAEALYRQAVGA